MGLIEDRTTGIPNDHLGTAYTTNGNCNCKLWGVNSSPYGPFRAGIYATSSSTREWAGASFWGILDLSGSLWEYALTLGNVTGRAFTGLHGDGKLTADGYADVAFWPSSATAVPSAMAPMPLAWTTAGMPSWAARMAVCAA